jgi:diguanylate cyclase (GGDEF)-like protein
MMRFQPPGTPGASACRPPTGRCRRRTRSRIRPFDVDTQNLRHLAGDARTVLDSDLPRADQIEMPGRMMCTVSTARYTDPLTAVRNRRGILRDGAQVLAMCAAQSGRALVRYLDVDNLTAVNDADGHAVGDVLVRHAATALQAPLHSGDIVARLGGNEFAASAPATHAPAARRLSGRPRRELARVHCTRTKWLVELSASACHRSSLPSHGRWSSCGWRRTTGCTKARARDAPADVRGGRLDQRAGSPDTRSAWIARSSARRPPMLRLSALQVPARTSGP